MRNRRAAVIIGVGPERGLGAALAKRFAAQKLHVYLAGRSEIKLQAVVESMRAAGGAATPVVANAANEQQVAHLFNIVGADGRQVEIAAYNVDSNLPAPLLQTDTETFTELWRQNCLGAFFFGKAAIEAMLPNQRGTLFFTGATASLRAKPPFTAFATSKAGLRALAQGMAREFSAQGIHVVHAVLDGVIDGERARRQFPAVVEMKGEEGLMKLEAIADTYWALHCQHPSAWTHELDLRPYKEPFY